MVDYFMRQNIHHFSSSNVVLMNWKEPTTNSSKSSVLNGVRVTRSLVLCVCFVDHGLSFFFGHSVVSIFDLRILITPLASSNSS
jgi:hypothetical protein